MTENDETRPHPSGDPPPVANPERELAAIVETLNRAKIDYAVCGAFALAVHGFVRATQDIDFLVRTKDVSRIKAAIKPLGYIVEASPMTFRRGTERETRVNRVSRIVGEDVVTVDLIEADKGWMDVWKTRAKIALPGYNIKAVSREGLKTMKLSAGRPQDLVDIQRLEETLLGKEHGTLDPYR